MMMLNDANHLCRPNWESDFAQFALPAVMSNSNQMMKRNQRAGLQRVKNFKTGWAVVGLVRHKTLQLPNSVRLLNIYIITI